MTAWRSVSAWRSWDWGPKNDRDYTALDITRQSANPSWQDQWSQELRLSSNGANRIDWTAGLYAFHQAVETHGVTEYGRDAGYWLIPAYQRVAGAPFERVPDGGAPRGVSPTTSRWHLPASHKWSYPSATIVANDLTLP